MIYSQQRIQGYVCHPWLLFEEGKGNYVDYMHKALNEGAIKVLEKRVDGIENWPKAFISLFQKTEDKLGKVWVAPQHDDKDL